MANRLVHLLKAVLRVREDDILETHVQEMDIDLSALRDALKGAGGKDLSTLDTLLATLLPRDVQRLPVAHADPDTHGTANDYEEVNGSRLDTYYGAKWVVYVLRNYDAVNAATYKVQGSVNTAEEWVDLTAEINLGAGEIKAWAPSDDQRGYPYYRVVVKSAVADAQAWVRVRGHAKG